MQRIDAHQHFWTIERNNYGRLTADLAPIYRDFLPAHLPPLLTQHQIVGTIVGRLLPPVLKPEQAAIMGGNPLQFYCPQQPG